MKVFPQLPAFICNRDEKDQQDFADALKCIARVFGGVTYHELRRSAGDPQCVGIFPSESNRLLLDYLESELRLLFRNQHVLWEEHWKNAKSAEGQSENGAGGCEA